jgi:hypothetical protein
VQKEELRSALCRGLEFESLDIDCEKLSRELNSNLLNMTDKC